MRVPASELPSLFKQAMAHLEEVSGQRIVIVSVEPDGGSVDVFTNIDPDDVNTLFGELAGMTPEVVEELLN